MLNHNAGAPARCIRLRCFMEPTSTIVYLLNRAAELLPLGALRVARRGRNKSNECGRRRQQDWSRG